MRSGALGLAGAMLLAGCASAPSNTWTSADTVEYDQFRAERLARAQGLAREGDQALATSAERALERYTLALRAIGLRGRLGLDGKGVDGGYQITEVVPDYPAARAGLRVGDLVVRMRGLPTEDMSLAQRDIAFQRNPGEAIPMTVRRAGCAPFEATVVSRNWLWEPRQRREAEEELIRSLRFKAAAAAGHARALPQVPAVAREHATRAQAQARSAKTRSEFENASSEFRVASLLAPWWSDIYINHALFQEATEDAIGARESLALYLESRPGAADRAAVAQKQAALASKAREQERLMAWEGVWLDTVNGRQKDTGHTFVRSGRILTATRSDGFEYFRATIVDEFTARAVSRVKSNSPQCVRSEYNDLASVLRLSPDKKTITETLDNPMMDPRTCAVVRHNKEIFIYTR